MDQPEPASSLEHSDADTSNSQLEVSFCGLSMDQGKKRYKLHDWEADAQTWVNEGDVYRGFKVVGLNKEEDSLVMESNGFWFVYPLEKLTRGSIVDLSSRKKLILESDIPEGVDVMEFVSTHAEPLNPSGMPENMEIPNPSLDMPSK